MDFLVLGGTLFLGRAIVEDALARGHRVTIFTRGNTLPDLFDDRVTKIRGDRMTGHEPLRGRAFDAVIDTSGHFPRVVRDGCATLVDHAAHYTFVSTVSVYPRLPDLGMDEDAPVAELADPTVEQITGETYGGLKVLCERAVREAFGERACIVRPGLIVGRHDWSDRFTYWPVRVARGGDVLAPGEPDTRVQVIDVRDLAAWLVTCAERNTGGVFNAVGPDPELSMRALLDACLRVARSDARFTWIPDDFLLAQQVGPWMELPLWIPDDPDQRGFSAVSNARAVAQGLRFRPIEDTIADTLAWEATRPKERTWRAGLSPEKERAVLEAWRKDSGR